MVPDEVCKATSVTNLWLNQNRISSVSEGLWRLTLLVTLDLSGNRLTSISSAIAKLHNLKELNLNHNDLQTLPEEIGSLPCLTSLNVSRNPLTAFPSSIGKIPLLRRLRLDNNSCGTIPPSFGKLTQLEELSICSANLAVFPGVVLGNLTALRELQLNFNELASLPDEICQLRNLTSFRAYFNALTCMPHTLTGLKKLEILDVSHNKLTEFPNVKGLTTLQSLIVGHNPTTDCPKFVESLTNLTHLEFSHDSPAALPNLTKLTKLTKVLCTGGHFTVDFVAHLRQLYDFSAAAQLDRLPSTIRLATSLRCLNLSGNSLKILPEELCQLCQLQTLDVQNNELQCLPESLGTLKSLYTLTVSGNQLSKLPSSIGKLHVLWLLDCDYNCLEGLPNTIEKLTKLTTLYLKSNAITALPAGLVHLTKLSTLSLAGNPLPQCYLAASSPNEVIALLQGAKPPESALFMWGNNSFHKLGCEGGDLHFPTILRLESCTVGGGKLETVAVAFGYSHCVIVVEVQDNMDHKEEQCRRVLLACGSNGYGQLGVGRGAQHQRHLVLIKGLGSNEYIEYIACGYHHVAVAIRGAAGFLCPRRVARFARVAFVHTENRAAGSCRVFTWGNNTRGQLGHSGNYDSPVPKQVEALQDGWKNCNAVTALACGAFFTLVVLDRNEIIGWGANEYHQITASNECDVSVPTRAPLPATNTPISKVACGYAFTLALLESGEVFSWGCNADGQLGQGDTCNRSQPEQIRGLSEVQAIACGAAHAGALVRGGSLKMWGSNDHFQILQRNLARCLEPTTTHWGHCAALCCFASSTIVLNSDCSVSVFNNEYPSTIKVPCGTKPAAVFCGNDCYAAVCGNAARTATTTTTTPVRALSSTPKTATATSATSPPAPAASPPAPATSPPASATPKTRDMSTQARLVRACLCGLVFSLFVNVLYRIFAWVYHHKFL
eukprot:TRINITY_DN2379_c0_g1_i8.p1 TRINITY_DN2379_c0_g1~~TRINITY_DN2379_c0_g1_i8.p1  ORF type:complete len:1014 (-),score=142.83 TRINITY_DN2379_c0_g1_i8:8-2848(-)